MTAYTTRHRLAYLQPTDLVASIDDTMAEAMNRLDLALGETGSVAITPSAVDTTTSVRVNYSRSYATLPAVPVPFVAIASAVASTVTLYVWASAPDSTGFTLNIRASNTGARTVSWHVRAA